MDISQFTLSPQQSTLFDQIEGTSNNIFVTGKAGTGKSSLLQYFKLNTKKRIAVLAPTGVAALNVGGQTIHSFFKIPPEFLTRDKLKLSPQTATVIRHLDTLVIDEISMVRADLMDAIDYLCRQALSSIQPFGGLQIVMFGDLYQIPPIVQDPELQRYFAEQHGGHYFFNASVWQNGLPDIYELSTIFRQDDDHFKQILNHIRTGDLQEYLLKDLNRRVVDDIPEEQIITLVTTNQLVNQINHQRLMQLPGTIKQYKALLSGDIEQSFFPTEQTLILKPGAQVMFLKNDRDKRWVNGTIGQVESLESDHVIITVNGESHAVLPETWNKIRYSYNSATNTITENIIASFTQLPLRLAWAITIHKSQGQTFESAIIDIGRGAFTSGQTYVALSRCKSLEGLYLKRPIQRQHIIIDPLIINFMYKAKIIT